MNKKIIQKLNKIKELVKYHKQDMDHLLGSLEEDIGESSMIDSEFEQLAELYTEHCENTGVTPPPLREMYEGKIEKDVYWKEFLRFSINKFKNS